MKPFWEVMSNFVLFISLLEYTKCYDQLASLPCQFENAFLFVICIINSSSRCKLTYEDMIKYKSQLPFAL